MRHDDTNAGRAPAPRPSTDGGSPRGVVFDFGGRRFPDVRDLALLVTARMLAERDERPVWIRALPHQSWEVLQALGLDRLFHLFPAGGERDGN